MHSFFMPCVENNTDVLDEGIERKSRVSITIVQNGVVTAFGIADRGHALQDFQVGLYLCPFFWIFFGGDGRKGASIILDKVLFQPTRNASFGMFRKVLQELSVRAISQLVTAWFHLLPSIQVSV